MVCAAADLEVLGLLDGRGIGVVFHGESLHAQPCAAVGQQLHRRLVDQVSVFDASDSGFEGAGDSFRVVNVYHDVGSPVLGSLHGRADLRFEKFGHVQRIVQGCRAAPGHQFDLRGTLPQVFARGRHDGIGSVHDPRSSEFLRMGQFAAAARVGVFVDHSEIPVSGRLGDHRSAGVDAWAGQYAGVDGVFQSENGSAGVADGGESPLESCPGLSACNQVGEGGLACQQVHHRVTAEVGMPVGVD